MASSARRSCAHFIGTRQLTGSTNSNSDAMARALNELPQEFCAETADDCHVVKIVLRSMNIRLSVGGRTVQDGLAMPGMFHVTEPTVRARCLFRGPYDVLHLLRTQQPHC